MLGNRQNDLGTDYHDLLPDFTGKVGCQAFDLVDGVDHHFVANALHAEGGKFAGQRQHLGAIVEITHEVGRREIPLRRRGRPPRAQQARRILGQLVHVDHMRDGSQLMQGVERSGPLDPRLQIKEEPDRRAHQDQDIGNRLDALKPDLIRIFHQQSDFLLDPHTGHEQAGEKDERDKPAQQQVRPRDLAHPLHVHVRNPLKFGTHACQAPVRKALSHPVPETRERREDRVR